ncbi:MAG: glycosyltransferase family 1 protein [Oscillatoriales cyanobacterium]|nr:MAG: glycosyltransferase family 1 protein [Oscillatoriales cyanobacterium]
MLNSPKSNFGVNIIGHVSGEFGLGGGVRGTIRALEAANIPFTIKDLKEDSQRNLDDTYTSFSSAHSYPVNIVHTNPHESLLNCIDPDFFHNRYNIGFWIWELPVFPDFFMGAFKRFDEVWTYSNYTAETISDVSPLPVVKLPPSIYLPPNSLDREALGLPKDKFIFLFMFDMGSGFERKNPFATIEAFKKAFGKSNEDVLLIIKFRPHPAYQNQYEQLKALAEDWPSIQFIEGHLSKEEVHALVDNCKTMAEAMYYGKPVIATAYSSNTDFMNVGNSFLVKYDLVATTEAYGLYPKGSIWAEPDINHAASLMEYVFQNYPQAQQVGARAAKEIRSLFSPEVIGQKIRHRLEYITRTIEEKGWYESQAQAWKQAALQAQRELDRARLQF